MKSKELRQKKQGLLATLNVLAEKSELTGSEKSEWDKKTAEVEALNREIDLQEKAENRIRSKASREVSKNDNRDVQGYSLIRALKGYLEGSLDGIEREMHQEAERESKNLQGIEGFGIPLHVLKNKKVATRATLVAGSSPVVPVEKVGFIDALYAKTLLVEMGAQTMTGLTGNIDMPYLSAKPSLKWAATENEAAADATAGLDDHNLSPKRITNFIPVSQQLLMQNTPGIEQKLWDTLIKATAVKVDAGGINGSGSPGEPTGILNKAGIGAVVGGENGAYPTFNHILQLVKEVAASDADIGALGFLTNALVRYKLQTTAIESGDIRRVWATDVRDRLIDYKAGVTTLVPDDLTKGTAEAVCSAIIFGNFNDITIGQFGSIDLLADPYTSGKENTVNLITHSYWDILIEHAGSFAAMKDALI